MLVFLKLAVCAAVLNAAGVAAVPAIVPSVADHDPTIPEGVYVVQKIPNSNVTVYDWLPEYRPKPPVVDSRAATCGTSTAVCTQTNRANVDSCRDLLNDVQAHASQIVNGTMLCLPYNICCITLVSTSNAPISVHEGSLYDAGQDVFNTCNDGYTVAGYKPNVNLEKTCMAQQCLQAKIGPCPV